MTQAIVETVLAVMWAAGAPLAGHTLIRLP
jgi:hypothetical protein